jgi:hypothetical protein
LLLAIAALVIPWNPDIAEHVPTSLDAGGVMRVRTSNGWYQVEAKEGESWRVVARTRRRSTVQGMVDLYTG